MEVTYAQNKLNWRSWPLAIKLTLMMTLLIIVIVAGVTLLSIRREQQTFQMELEQQAELILSSLLVTEPTRSTSWM